jgi:hypothetical protein
MPDAALLPRSAPSSPEAHSRVKAIASSGASYGSARADSKRRVLRLMREHDLLAPSRVGPPRDRRSQDGARRRCSLPSTIARSSASAATPRRTPPVSKRSDRSGKGRTSTSAVLGANGAKPHVGLRGVVIMKGEATTPNFPQSERA